MFGPVFVLSKPQCVKISNWPSGNSHCQLPLGFSAHMSPLHVVFMNFLLFANCAKFLSGPFKMFASVMMELFEFFAPRTIVLSRSKAHRFHANNIQGFKQILLELYYKARTKCCSWHICHNIKNIEHQENMKKDGAFGLKICCYVHDNPMY